MNSISNDSLPAINWQKLADIPELTPYFTEDGDRFRARIQHHLINLQQIDPQELDKLALLRVLEVTNGCTQWAFRRQDKNCLSVEQTRECMKQVMGFIKNKKILLAQNRIIEFTPIIEQLIDEGRQLYQDAFKNQVAGAEQEYYAYSTAQFLIYGRQRLEQALGEIRQEFEALFTPYYLEKGRRYIAPYLEALVINE
ncbi:MAG: hypothetical protein ACKO1W_14745 [Microcystaceae cyanobacterium]